MFYEFKLKDNDYAESVRINIDRIEAYYWYKEKELTNITTMNGGIYHIDMPIKEVKKIVENVHKVSLDTTATTERLNTCPNCGERNNIIACGKYVCQTCKYEW